ncbi:hypothetical protein XU19_23665, partial [Vibrio parahaemolyticus]
GKYYGGAGSPPVVGAIMGGGLRTRNIGTDALAKGEKREFVIKQSEGKGGREELARHSCAVGIRVT